MTRAYRLVPVFLILALSAGSVARRTGARPQTYIRECAQAHWPQDSDLAVYLLASGTAGIPEYNDCQRFIIDGKYDSLYAIYATHPKTVALGPKVAVLVAVIRSFGGTYQPLGIKPGLNCVYLSGDRRLARVVDSANYFPCCPIVALSQLPAPFLEARPTVAKGFERDSDYPQVARWDYALNRVQYMGVKCENAWCEIGPPKFLSSPTWTPESTVPLKMRRNMMIKGWYDEQILADTTPSTGGLPHVSGVRGTIFPSERLADYDEATWKGQWRVIAYVATPRTSQKYLDSMNFAPTPFAKPATPLDPRKLNRIELCAGSDTDCKVPPPTPTCPVIPTWTGATAWGWSRITRPGDTKPKYRCVARWSNAGMTDFTGVPLVLPASTRWRWVTSDELSWSQCSAGCCEVH